MNGPLDEFFGDVEDEFDVQLSHESRGMLRTPGAIIDILAEETSPSDGMTAEEHRDHIAAVVGELIARSLGITRYAEDSRFLEDLHVR